MVVERRTYTLAEAAKVLGISPGKVAELTKTGKIKALRFGRRVVIPKTVVDRMLED